MKKCLKIVLICVGAAAIGHRLLEYFTRNHRVALIGGVDGPTAIYVSKKSCPVTNAVRRIRQKLQAECGQP